MRRLLLLLIVAMLVMVPGKSAFAVPVPAPVAAGPGDPVFIDWSAHAQPVYDQLVLQVGPDRVFDVHQQGAENIFSLPPISYDPYAGPIYKLIDPTLPENQLQTVMHIRETMQVGPDMAWAGWHEEILTPGWSWAWGPEPPTVTYGGGGVLGVAGVLPSGALDFSVVDFFFDRPLLPGDEVTIDKFLVHDSLLGFDVTFDPNMAIVIAEYPTSPVPVPGAVWLLGTGLVSLFGARKRMKK